MPRAAPVVLVSFLLVAAAAQEPAVPPVGTPPAATSPAATSPAASPPIAPPAAPESAGPEQAPAAAPEQAPAEPYGHSRHGGEFDEGPRRAAYRMPGLSEQVHFPVARLTSEAQAFFDQGVCQQHGFWYFEAERSFRQVAMLQPECALAYWGMAMANVENATRAAGFAAQAVQRAKDLPERERLYVDAIATLYQIDDATKAELQSGDAMRATLAKAALVKKNGKDAKPGRDEKKLQRAFLRGLEAVVAACPGDVEAKAFLAIQSWRNTDHGIEISSHGAVDALLDQVFAAAPLHPAHHYRIHLWDREKAERALASAAVNGDTAPAIAHQWHMSGHIYAKLHRHAEAAWQQQASGRVDHAAMLRDRTMPFLIHNYGHNQEWLARSLSYVGDGTAALAVAKNLAELPRHPKHNQVDVGDDIAGYARARLVQVCEDLELWEDAVELCRGGWLERSDSVKGEVQRLGLLGRALFRLGRLDDAERVVGEVDALLTTARAKRAEAMAKAEDDAFGKHEDAAKTKEAAVEAGREPTSTVRSVLDLQRELRGERLLAKNDAKAALVEFTAVKDFPKVLLADAHVAAGDAAKAIELLEAEVKERPKRAATIGRLMLAYHALPEGTDAQKRRGTELFQELLDVVGDHAATQHPTPYFKRLSIGIDARVPPRPVDRTATTGFPADFGPRPDLASLGPAAWRPTRHPGLDLPRVGAEARFTLPASPGRATLVVFYLGFGCLHCVQQLQALAPRAAEFAAAGVDVVAIGNEPLTKAADALAALPDAQRPCFPLLADPELDAFRAWQCHDDFERMPLHGTFLVDGDGLVRWQDVSFEPFTQFDWLLIEAKRLLALPATAASK